MSVTFKKYKAKFRYSLRPFFIMINNKRKGMETHQWTEYIHQIKTRILHNPMEFLGEDLPEPKLMADILDDVFDEFLRERAYLDHSSHRAH